MDTGTIVAILGGVGGLLVSVVSAIAAARLRQRTQQAEQKQADLDYLFAQYRLKVDELKKEHAEDREALAVISVEHLKCREDLAAMRERVTALEAGKGRAP